jgi:DNA phosphorothioation-dependent restriction protein DptG
MEKIIKEWEETEEAYRELSEKREELERKIISEMAERQWNDYKTKTGTHISIVDDLSTEVNTDMLSVMLTKGDYASVVRTIRKEKLIILTKNGLKRLKKFLR